MPERAFCIITVEKEKGSGNIIIVEVERIWLTFLI